MQLETSTKDVEKRGKGSRDNCRRWMKDCEIVGEQLGEFTWVKRTLGRRRRLTAPRQYESTRMEMFQISRQTFKHHSDPGIISRFSIWK